MKERVEPVANCDRFIQVHKEFNFVRMGSLFRYADRWNLCVNDVFREGQSTNAKTSAEMTMVDWVAPAVLAAVPKVAPAGDWSREMAQVCKI